MSVSVPKQLIPHLSESLRHELEQKGSLRSFPAGSVILKENMHIRSIPILLSGIIKVLREDENGREILLYYVKPGESCVMSIFGGIHHDISKIKALCEEESEMLLLPSEEISDWIKNYPEWLDFVLALYHKRFEELLGVVNEIAFRKMDERILNLLKKKSSVLGTDEISVTHQQLADEINTSREVVSRLLKQLEKDQLIELHRNKIVLKQQ